MSHYVALASKYFQKPENSSICDEKIAEKILVMSTSVNLREIMRDKSSTSADMMRGNTKHAIIA